MRIQAKASTLVQVELNCAVLSCLVLSCIVLWQGRSPPERRLQLKRHDTTKLLLYSILPRLSEL